MGHRQYSPIVILIVAIELAFDGVTGATVTHSVRASALDNEVGNNAVKGESVVKSFLGQRDEIFYGIWSVFLEESDLHDAFCGVDFGCFHFLDLGPQINMERVLC